MADLAHVDWTARPELRRPVVVAAFEGWNDAGDAATSALDYVRGRWSAKPFASIDGEEFYDFATTRPQVELDDDGQRHIIWPRPEFAAAPMPSTGRDVITLMASEPQMRWRTFCEQVVGVARETNVETVITLGALLAEVPHSRPVPVYGTTDDANMAEELNLTPSRYEGPTGIVGVLSNACREAGLRSASLWAAVPTYVPSAPSPKAALALVERLTTMLEVGSTTTDLEIAAASYERQVNEVVAQDEDTAEYVAQLEDHYDNEIAGDDPLSADQLVEEVERFLREQPD